jgi:hypothetical protein
LRARGVGRDNRDVESNPEADRLLTLIQWTLDRILSLEYEVTLDSDGNPERLEVDPDYGLRSVETIEENLKACLPREWLENLFALRNRRTPDQVRAAVAAFPIPIEDQMGAAAFEKLLSADWEEIVASVYWTYLQFTDDLMSSVVVSRIGLGRPDAARFEADMQWSRPDALPEWAARHVVREMRRMLPAAAERLRRFQITPVTSAVPTNVAQYAREASRCYLSGLFSAALILCRSCIESGVEEKLVQKGLRKQLNTIKYNKVQAVLDLALNSGVLDDLTFAMANDIRRRANDAAHGTIPSASDCRERLELTRAVLRHLYE